MAVSNDGPSSSPIPRDFAGTFLTDGSVEAIHVSVEKLLKSELYRGRLRRTLVGGWDAKTLDDFLVLDNLFAAAHRALFLGRSEGRTLLASLRREVFLKAGMSAMRKLQKHRDADIRIIQMRGLYGYLLDDYPGGMSAEGVFRALCRPSPEDY